MNFLLRGISLVFLTCVAAAGPAAMAGEVVFGDSFEQPPPVVTVHWDGGGDGTRWADPLNWDGDQLPQPGNAVVINDPGTPTVVYEGSLGTTNLHSLETTESLSLTGGTLRPGAFAWTQGTLTIGAAAAVTVLGAFDHTGGTVTGAGPLTVEGLFNWAAGTQSGGGETTAKGGLDMLSAGDNNLVGRTLTVHGTTTYLGDLRAQDGAVINNHGTFDIQNDEDLTFTGGAAPTFNNFGTLMKSGGTAESEIELDFNNAGTVSVASGMLTLGESSNSASGEGVFTALAPGTLRLRGSHTLLPASSVTGDGTLAIQGNATNVQVQGGFLLTGPVQIVSGTLDFGANPVTVAGPLVQTGGNVTGSAQLTIDGLFTWTTGSQSGPGETVANGGLTMTTLDDRFLSARTLSLYGPTVHAGDLRLLNGATIDNFDSFDIQNDELIRHQGGALPEFNNHGTLTKSAGSGNSEIQAVFTNHGQLSVDSGSVSFDQTFTQSGTGTLGVAIAGAADFDSYAVAQSASLDGTLDIELVGGFEPLIGETYTILTFGSRAGTFATVNGLVFDPGVKRFDISYGATEVVLEVVADP